MQALVINAPIAVILLLVHFLEGMSWTTMAIALVLASFLTVPLVLFVLDVLEVLTRSVHTNDQVLGSSKLTNIWLSIRNLHEAPSLPDVRILESLPDPLLMINERSNIVFVNQSAREFFGDTLLHQSLQEAFPDASFAESVRTEELFEWAYQPEGERPYTFQVRIERLPARARRGAVAVIVFNDVTPFKLFKQQQADFFANASHELKTPLSIVSGFIETLQGPAKDDAAAREKFLVMMAEQTNRMTHLVQDLLVLSRLQMTDKTTQRDVILISDLIKGVLENLADKAAKNHKTLKLNLAHDLPRFIGNRTEMHQAIQNLIDNAIKYGAENSAVTITARLCNGFPQKSDKYFSDLRQVISIAVHNAGAPIPPHLIPRLFERFYRGDFSKIRRADGTGLGLGIVQQIIQKHDGVIDAESRAETGTTFTIYLPIDL